MKVKIDAKKKIITLTSSGKERKIFSLIYAFAGDAIVNVSKSKLQKLASMYIDKIIIDMTHESISKEFIQLLLRFQK